MFEVSEQTKKYIFIGATVILFIIFIISGSKNTPKKNIKKQNSCCMNSINEDKLKKLYSFEEDEKEEEDNSKNNIVIMNFNTDWCGYSKKFQPIWDEFTSKMKGKNISVKDVKCDNNQNEKICEKYKIEGFPTVKLVKNNKQYEFRGRRTVDDLNDFVQTHL